jgi:hypothetical protein
MSCRLTITTSLAKRSSDFISLLAAVDRIYDPKPGLCVKPVVIVLDNGPIHVSKAHEKLLRRAPAGSLSSGGQYWHSASLKQLIKERSNTGGKIVSDAGGR